MLSQGNQNQITVGPGAQQTLLLERCVCVGCTQQMVPSLGGFLKQSAWEPHPRTVFRVWRSWPQQTPKLAPHSGMHFSIEHSERTSLILLPIIRDFTHTSTGTTNYSHLSCFSLHLETHLFCLVSCDDFKLYDERVPRSFLAEVIEPSRM